MSEYETLKESRLSSELIFDGVVLHVYKDDIRLPNGHESTREVIRHLGAVAIVPMTEEGKVIMERQFRYPLDAVITEIPAGKLDSPSEDRLEAAKRELREETGYSADEWINLGDYFPSAAYTDERLTIYLARGLHQGQQELDEDEFLNFDEVPLDTLVAQVMDGTITDGKTQIGILKAARYLGK